MMLNNAVNIAARRTGYLDHTQSTLQISLPLTCLRHASIEHTMTCGAKSMENCLM